MNAQATVEATVERTLTVVREAHMYSLPPRPSSGGWRCQDWPKSSHIFTGCVRVVSAGTQCNIRIEDPSTGSLFATCPLSNDSPEVSVESASDSSRYFVIRVADGAGRHAFLGLGFVERNDAFDFQVALQDHVKHVRFEAQIARDAESGAPAAPPQDFSLKGNVSIAIPLSRQPEAKPRERPASSAAPAGALLLLPPPPGGGAGRRPKSEAAEPPAPAPFETAGDGWATF